MAPDPAARTHVAMDNGSVHDGVTPSDVQLESPSQVRVSDATLASHLPTQLTQGSPGRQSSLIAVGSTDVSDGAFYSENEAEGPRPRMPVNPFLEDDEDGSEVEKSHLNDSSGTEVLRNDNMELRTSITGQGESSLTSRGRSVPATSRDIRRRSRRRSMAAVSRRFRSLAPDLADPDGLVRRILGPDGRGANEEGLFVKTEPDLGENGQNGAFNIDSGEDDESDEGRNEEFHHEE
jgi:hypothetical protein